MLGLSEVQDMSSDGIILKRFVTREPFSIFSLRRNAKNKGEKQRFNQLLELLKKKVPDGFYIGAAVAEEDCFFDSIAQGLNELQNKGLITGPNKFNVKSLRESCKQYAQQVNQSNKDSWLVIDLKEEGRKLRKYIQNIEFTAKDIESGSKLKIIWGRPEIEGKIICEKYGVKVRIIELREEEIEGFVTKSKLGTGSITIRVLNYKNHFVPLLSNIQKNVKRCIKVCKEEVYGNVIGSNSSNFTQLYISTLLKGNENFSHRQSDHSRNSNKGDHKTSRKRRCSVSNQDNKASKRACIEVNIVDGKDTKVHSDEQKETRMDELHRKRKWCNEDNDKKAPKRIHVNVKSTNNECLFSNDLHHEFKQDKLNNAFQIIQCIPHQLIRFMHQLDLSILCSLRESVHKYKYPSLSLTFGDYEIDKFGNITIYYNAKSIHIQILSVEKYYIDNDISYASLFNKRKSFCINNYLNSFVKHLISKLNSFSNYIEYLIIYTNSGLDLTEKMKLKQCRCRIFYPFEFDSINIDDCDILKDFLFTNDNITGRGFYQFSKNKATREELLKRLEISSTLRKEIEEKKLYPNFEKEIKESFLDKLVFAVNQPNREELNSIIKNEINSKVTYNYLELQERILCVLKAQKFHKMHVNYVPEIIYSFSLLMSFLHDMFLHKNIFSINVRGRGCDGFYVIVINYKDRTTYINVLNADSNIRYSHLFPSRIQERKTKFSINKHFTNFIEKSESDKNIRYYVIYTNAGLDLTEENRFKKVQSKNFFPFKLDNIDFHKKRYKIFKNCLCANKNDFFNFNQFSQEEIKLSNLLKLPPSFQREKEEMFLGQNEKEIKAKFVRKLIFAVNQPHRKELDKMIKKEIENKCNKVPYNYEELKEITLRLLESHEFGPITKERMELVLADIKMNRSSCEKTQYKNITEKIKFARSVVGVEGTHAFNQFLYFLIKEGRKHLKVLRRQGINLPNMSSILKMAGNNATRSFIELYNLWFDTKGNKSLYLQTLEDNGVNIDNLSGILNGAGIHAAEAFKDLYALWFDVKGNKTQYLRNIQGERVTLTNMSCILHGAGIMAAKAFKDLHDLWFDTKGNKTLCFKTLENEGVNLTNMSGILKGAGSKAAKAFKSLYDLWFDAKGNKTLYMKTLEDAGLNLCNMSSILNGAGTKAKEAYKDLYDLWFDEKGNKTEYLKTLENEVVKLRSMSSILNGAGYKAAKAFKDLYNLWFDAKGNKTLYMKTLEDAGVNLSNMSSILTGAGSKAGKAFKDLYDLWFDAKGNKTLYFETLGKEGVHLRKVSSILNGAGSKAKEAFKDFHDIWFDEKGNKTEYLKTLEAEGVNLHNMSSILRRVGSRAGKDFKDLHGLWFAKKEIK